MKTGTFNKGKVGGSAPSHKPKQKFKAGGPPVNWVMHEKAVDEYLENCKHVSRKGEVSYSRRPKSSLRPEWLRNGARR